MAHGVLGDQAMHHTQHADTPWSFIDLVPKNAGKGSAMRYLQRVKHGFQDHEVVAAGDSCNDLLMLDQVGVQQGERPQHKQLQSASLMQVDAMAGLASCSMQGFCHGCVLRPVVTACCWHHAGTLWHRGGKLRG